MLNECPEIIVEVEHQEAEPLFFKALGQLDGSGGLAGSARAADPKQADLIAGIEAGNHFFCRLIQRGFVPSE